MDEYTKLNKKIESYFQMEDVKEDTETISALTLYNIVNEKI